MVDESTRMILKKKNRQSLLKTLLVLLVVLLFMGTTIIFVVLLNPARQVVADPLATPTNVSVDETGTFNSKQYTLSFDAVANADYYTVFIFSSEEEAQNAQDTHFANLYPTLSFNGTTKDITTYLSKEGMYYFSVQAICKNIPSFSSDPSNPLNCSYAVYYYLSTPSVTVTNTQTDNGSVYQCSWEPIEQASGYELDVVRADTQISILTDVIAVSVSDYVLNEATLTLMNNQSTTDFNVLVRAIGSEDDDYVEASEWGSAMTHTYKAIAKPVVEYSYTTPNNVETHKIKWQLLDYARYFEIYINGALVETLIGSTITEATITNYLPSYGTYTVKVIAKNDSYYVANAESDEITFDVYATTPTVTGLSAHRSGANIEVYWTPDTSSTTYMIYVRNKENQVIVPPNSEVEYSVVSNTGFFDIPIIWNEEGYYSISIIAKRDNHYFTVSDTANVVFQFPTTELTAPVVAYNENDNTLVWQAIANASGNPVASDNNGFTVRVWTLNSEGEEVDVLNTFVAKTLRYYNLYDFLATNGVNTYYASVKALGGYLIWQDSDESESVSFKHTESLAVPEITITDDDTGISSTNPTLSWGVVENAVAYDIGIDGVKTNITITVGEPYTISNGYIISEDTGIISVTGWDTHFANLPAGTYNFTVKAIAEANDESVYTDSDWSEGADFVLVRALATPVITDIKQDTANNSNVLYVCWDRMEGEDTIYDEDLQTFNIWVNDLKVVTSLIPDNARADGITGYYQYNIGDFLTPGDTNTVIVEAAAYGIYTGAKSATQANVSYYYYLSSAYSEKNPVQIVGEVNQTTENVVYTLYFYNLKFANHYEFTFNSNNNQHIDKNVFNNRSTGIQTKVDISSSWITPYNVTSVRVVFSYDESLAYKDTDTNPADKDFIISYDWNYSYTDEARLAPVGNLSYDGGSRFTWTYDDAVIDGVGHFAYSYQFTQLSQDEQTGTSAKSNSYVDDNITYYYVDVDFAYAGEILFKVTPISSSIKRQNGATVTDTFDVKTTLDTPQNLSIKEDDNGLYIEWTPVNNVNLTDAYTLQLYADGVQIGSDLLVGNSSDTIKVYGSRFNLMFDEQVTYYVKVKCNAHSPTSNNTDYYYRESAWATSEEYLFTPKIYAPLISVNENSLQILKSDNANTYIIYYSTATTGADKTDITQYLTSVVEDSNYLTYDLTTYFNVNNLSTGQYYISVIAKNTNWNKSSVESEKSAYDYNIQFAAPVVNNIQGSTTKITMNWNAVTGTNYGNLSVNPTGYEVTIGLSNRAYARLLTLQVLYDATAGYKIKVVGGLTYSPNNTEQGTSSTVYTYDIGALTVYANSFEFIYNAGILSAKSEYVADFTTMGNSTAYFVDSHTTSSVFTCYSITIVAPTIYFYDSVNSSLVSTYQTSSDSLILYILKTNYSQTFDIQGVNLFASGEVVTLTKQSGQETDLNGNVYKVYQLSQSAFTSAGIYSIQVKYNANKTAGAGESDYSNDLYLYYSEPVKPASNLTLTTKSTGSYSPVEVNITLPTSQITDSFRGFALKTLTTETTPRTTVFTLGTTGSYGYTRLDNTTTKITTITYQIPIAEITGFGSTWQTLLYDFKFEVQVRGAIATTGLISTYGLSAQCLDSFAFYTNSGKISTTLNTSAQTSKPSNIQLDQTGKVTWASSGTNVNYYYVYYAWDLSNNSYTLFYNNGGTLASESLVVTDNVLYLNDGTTPLNSIIAGDTKWFTTTSAYFNIQNFSLNNNYIYGVYIYAQKAPLTASDITIQTLSKAAVLPNFTMADIVVTYDGATSKYYLTWTDIFTMYDSSLVADKDNQYIVYFGNSIITLDSTSIESSNVYYDNGKVFLDVTDIIGGNGHSTYICRITIKAFSVTALETSLSHNVLLSKTVEGSIYTPYGIDDTVSGVNVIWNSDKTVCLSSWETIADATAYNLLVTSDTVIASNLKDGNGNLYTTETSAIVLGNKVVSINEIDINNVQYDITEWLSSLSLSAGSYKLWVCVADDEEENIISSENVDANSSGIFTYYSVCNSVTNLTYSVNNSVKTISWTNDLMNDAVLSTDYAYKYVVYKLQLKNVTTNEFVEFTNGVSAVYFKNDANTNTTAFSGITFYSASVVENNVVIDVTGLFNSVTAGNYILFITACPSSNASEYKNSEPTTRSIINTRQLVLNSSQYLSIMVDSYIDSVVDGVVTYDDNTAVAEHLTIYNFNTKVVTLLQELPDGAIGLGVIIHKNGEVYATQEFRTGSAWKLNLDAGEYSFDIYAIGDLTYYLNSEVKSNDTTNLEVYTRHTINDVNSKVTISRDEDENITGVSITHGISEINASYQVYCYKYDGTAINGVGDFVWVSAIKTITSATMVDILGDIMANADKMSFAKYIFKVKWLATATEKLNNVLDSDLNETKGMVYTHEMNIQKPQMQTDSNGNVVLVGHDAEGYVTSTQLKWNLDSPLINSILQYQVNMWNKDKGNEVSYIAYIKVTYGLVGNEYVPTYELLNSGNYVSDETFSLSSDVLTFNMLSYIDSTSYHVGDYYYNIGLVDVIKLYADDSTEDNVVTLNNGIWYYTQNLVTYYTHQDIYATVSDKWDVDNAGTDLLISNITLNSSGMLSWNFTDNPTFQEAYRFVINVNGTGVDSTIYVEYVLGQTSYSWNIGDRLWADNSTTQNVNNITIRLEADDDYNHLNESNWLSTPVIIITSSSASDENPVYDETFTWATDLAVGGNIDADIDTWNTDSQDVLFSYLFNKYYSKDGQLYTDAAQQNTMIRFVIEVLYSTDDLTSQTFDAAYDNNSMNNRKYIIISQEQIESWIEHITSSEYKMTFNSKDVTSYGFNLESLLNYMDDTYATNWINLTTQTLEAGYYYLNISLVDDALLGYDSAYENGSIWSEASYVKAPWKVSNTTIIDGHTNSADKTLILASDSATDEEKYAWADDVSKTVYLEFNVEKIDGEAPASYNVLLYYGSDADGTLIKRNASHIISQQDNGDYVTVKLNISDLFNEDGSYEYISGLYTFRVVALGNSVAKESTINSSVKVLDNNALVNYVRLGSVSVDFTQSTETSSLILNWNWNFPEGFLATLDGTVNIDPMLQIYNYDAESDGELYGSDSFDMLNVISYNDNVKVKLIGIIGVGGSYTYTFTSTSSDLHIIRSLSEETIIYNYLKYQVLVPEGSAYSYLLNSKVVEQTVDYVAGYEAPYDVQVENRQVNNEYIYALEDDDNLGHSYNEISFNVLTESFVEGTYDNKEIKYSYVQLRVYKLVNNVRTLINGTDGIIFKISYYSSSNTGATIASVEWYDTDTGVTTVLGSNEYTGSVDLTSTTPSISITLLRAQLKWLFDNIEDAHTPSTLDIRFNIYTSIGNVHNSVNSKINNQQDCSFVHNVRLETPEIDSIEFLNNENDDNPDIGDSDGNPYLIYTGQSPDFTIEMIVSNVSDYANALYITVANGTDSSVGTNNSFLIYIRNDDGTLKDWITEIGSGNQTYKITINTEIATSALFDYIVSLTPNKLYFYVQSVSNVDLSYYTAYEKGKITIQLNDESIFVDSYRSDIVDTYVVKGSSNDYKAFEKEVLRELVNPTFDFGFSVINYQSSEFQDESAIIDGITTNLVGAGNNYQVAYPYLYIQGYDGIANSGSMSEQINFEVEFKCDLNNDGTFSTDEVTTMILNNYESGKNLMSSSTSDNYNFYISISNLISKAQGKVIVFTIYAKHGETTYWLDQDYVNNVNNNSESESLLFYHNVSAKNASIGSLTYSDEETEVYDEEINSYISTGLLKPSNIPLTWSYDAKGTTQAVSGYRIVIEGKNDEDIIGFMDTETSDTAMNLVTANWEDKSFDFNNWANLDSTRSQGVWNIQISPYYKLDNGYIVYGTAVEYEYALVLKLSDTRNLTTTYSFSNVFTSQLVSNGTLADMGVLAVVNMIKTNQDDTNGTAINVHIGAPADTDDDFVIITEDFCTGFQIKISKNGNYIGKINSIEYPNVALKEFSIRNITACLDYFMNSNYLMGGEYEISYMLNAKAGVTLDSEWSSVFTFIYCKAYDGSSTTLSQSGTKLVVNRSSDSINYSTKNSGSCYLKYSLLQYDYLSGVLCTSDVTNSTSAGSISRFSVDKLEALTLTDSSLVSSKLASGYVYNVSNRGYVQLGSDTVENKFETADTTYNIGYVSTISTTFSLPSEYGPSLLTSDYNAATIVTLVEGAAVKFYSVGYDSGVIDLIAQQTIVNGKTVTTYSTSQESYGITVLNTKSEDGVDVYHQAGVSRTLSMKAYKKMGTYIDKVYVMFNSYNYLLSISNISGLTNTVTTANTFAGDGITKTRTVSFTYTLTYFKFDNGNGNAFTSYGVKSISQTKSYATDSSSSSLEEVDSTVDIATVYGDANIWYTYDHSSWPGNIDGWFKHNYEFIANLSTAYSQTKVNIYEYVHLETHYKNQISGGAYVGTQYVEPVYDEYTWYTSKDTGVGGIELTPTSDPYDLKTYVAYCLGLNRVFAMDTSLDTEQNKKETVYRIKFYVSGTDIVTAYKKCIGES